MKNFIRKALIVVIPLLVIAIGVVGYIAHSKGAFAMDAIFNTDAGAIGGYDTVAYFTQSAAVSGSPEIVAEFAGQDWLFSSEENKALFLQDPEKYVPQYGGYCSYARSIGFTAYSDPTAWSIVDGRLFLNLNHDVREVWSADAEAKITAADAYWQKYQTD